MLLCEELLKETEGKTWRPLVVIGYGQAKGDDAPYRTHYKMDGYRLRGLSGRL
ncbi:hypothetical protein M378DRAFT_162484, partial [Amanita muscaria Koide BX008]